MTRALRLQQMQIETICVENPAVQVLLQLHFGTSRLKRGVYRLRIGPAALGLGGFIATTSKPIACIFFWPICLPDRSKALLLGPLAVAAQYQQQGYARQLITRALHLITTAKSKALQRRWICVSGETNYYRKFGFQPAPKKWQIPGGITPPNQLLIKDLSLVAHASSHSLPPFDDGQGLLTPDPVYR